MFKVIKLGEGVRPFCQLTGMNPTKHSCSLTCKDPSMQFQGVTMVHCRAGKLSHKKGMAKCVPPPDPKSLTDCGPVTNRFKFLKGALPNCDGKRLCKPQCPEGQSPTRKFIKCKNPKRKLFAPKKGVVTCNAAGGAKTQELSEEGWSVVGFKTTLGRCGDLLGAGKNQGEIDSSVGAECNKKNCRLFCKSKSMQFDEASKIWETKKVGCNKKGFVPKVINAKCISLEQPDSRSTSVETPCDNTVFEKYKVDSSQVSASCTNSYCKVKCISTGAAPSFTWPDGTVMKKDNFKCQRGTTWKPDKGTISCP